MRSGPSPAPRPSRVSADLGEWHGRDACRRLRQHLVHDLRHQRLGAALCDPGLLRHRAPAVYRLIWGNGTVVMLAVAFGSISFMTYAISVWAPPYAIRTFYGT